MQSPQLVFLHTAAIHVQAFDTLLRQLRPRVRARHVVREDLLVAAQGDEADTNRAKHEVSDAIAGLRGGSRLGGPVHLFDHRRISRGSRRAPRNPGDSGGSRDGGSGGGNGSEYSRRRGPGEHPGNDASADPGIGIRVGVNVRTTRLVVADTWPFFEQGDFAAYLRRIADALKTVDDCDVVVLAQASMAGAAELCSGLAVPVLFSPRLGLESALAVMDANAARGQLF